MRFFFKVGLGQRCVLLAGFCVGVVIYGGCWSCFLVGAFGASLLFCRGGGGSWLPAVDGAGCPEVLLLHLLQATWIDSLELSS